MFDNFKITALVVGIALASIPCLAGDDTCDHCGNHCPCTRVCRVVCDMKEVTITRWCCKVEEFCVLGPSHRCQSGCNCGHCPTCRESAWIPNPAYIKTRKVPVKQTEKVLRPSYRVVVEYVCSACESHDSN